MMPPSQLVPQADSQRLRHIGSTAAANKESVVTAQIKANAITKSQRFSVMQGWWAHWREYFKGTK